MSEAALLEIDRSARQLLETVRANKSFNALVNGMAGPGLYREWLAQTAIYAGITAEVLATAAQSLQRAGGQLACLADDFNQHSSEEGLENPVILEDLRTLGADPQNVKASPPVAAYLSMLRGVAADPFWAAGVFGLIRTLELLAKEYAGKIYSSLSHSPVEEVRNALRFIEAHRNEEDHLARTASVICAVPGEYDPAIIWCGRMACLLYEGMLTHIDALREQ